MSNGGNDLIHPKLIEQYPSMNATARNLISGIPEGGWAKDYVHFLNTQLGRLTRKQRKGMISRIASTTDAAYYEAVAELVYMAFWDHLRWPSEKDPTLGEQTPDFKVSYGREATHFFCDVTVVRHDRPPRRIVLNSEGLNNIPKLPLVKEPLQQAHRFLMKIQEKFNKYESALGDDPLVICLFVYGHENLFYLDDFQVRNALFGDLKLNLGTDELWYEPGSELTAHGSSDKGIFGFDQYKIISAVLVCTEEFYQTRSGGPREPMRVNSWKVRFGFHIHCNPLGGWATEEKNPFSKAGFSVDGDPNYLEFW
jgi:hypothetical protein